MSKPYRICPNCGSHLDWGERCECEEGKPEAATDDAGQSAGQLATQQARKNSNEPALMLGA